MSGFLGFCAIIATSAYAVPRTWRTMIERAAPLWLHEVVATQAVDAGAYRSGRLPQYGPLGPPRLVRFAAITCWILGAMFIPGLVAAGLALNGLVMALLHFTSGDGPFFILCVASSIPGLVLAARLFCLGTPLLRGVAEAGQRARALASFATLLNAIIIAPCAIALVGTLLPAGADYRELAPVFGGTVIYAWISLRHARLLTRAAALVEANVQRHPATAPETVAEASSDAIAVRVAAEAEGPSSEHVRVATITESVQEASGEAEATKDAERRHLTLK